MGLNIASFNLYTFSSGENRLNVKSFDKIARIIIESGADIVALQEVIDQRSIDSLISELRALSGIRRRWQAFFDKKQTHRNNREGYAFLWDENIVNLPKDDYGESVVPQIMTRYTSLKRPPMVGRFCTVSGLRYEVCVINTHIIFNKDNYLKAQNHPEWYGSGAMRALEYSKIVRDIYPVFANHSNVYSVIAGDYNLTGRMLSLVNAAGNRKNDRPQMISVQDEKTTVKVFSCDERDRKDGGLPDSSETHNFLMGVFNGVLSLFSKERTVGQAVVPQGELILEVGRPNVDGDYVNDYDHFSFEIRRVAPYVKNPRRIAISETMFPLPNRRFHDYKTDVSDHVPVVATLDLKNSFM